MVRFEAKGSFVTTNIVRSLEMSTSAKPLSFRKAVRSIASDQCLCYSLLFSSQHNLGEMDDFPSSQVGNYGFVIFYTEDCQINVLIDTFLLTPFFSNSAGTITPKM